MAGQTLPRPGVGAAALTAAGLTAATAFVPPSHAGGAVRPSHADGAVRGTGPQARAGGPATAMSTADAPNGAGPALAGAAALGACAALGAGRGRALRGAARGAARAFDPAREVGAMVPLGYFDPLGFAKAEDAEGFRVLRSAELKHGRVAMMASIGLVAQHFLRLPGAEAVPAGLGALGTAVGQAGLLAVFAWGGVLEQSWRDDVPGREPGDFDDPLGLGMYDAEMRNRELNNGRFAMLAVLGIFAAELATGKDAVQQLGL